MLQFGLNHMTVARATYAELIGIAQATGCVGIEVRNDLDRPLFDGISAAEAGARARDAGLRLLAVAEVKRFNDWSDAKADEALALVRIAREAGAEAVSLIPRNDNLGLADGERQDNLRAALRGMKPLLEDHGLIGLIEPLGFEVCALRFKAEAVDAIDALDAGDSFRLVHDTFHHHLAGESSLYPAQTGIVHVSGVVDPGVSVAQMSDAHRILVDGRDRLGNLDQIAALLAAGYAGPVSFEAFAPAVHASPDPVHDLKLSMEFIRSHMAAHAA